ncbi:MAG: DUF2061 domain-containing protein [Candidatus Omnitrophota bacterium]|nr:DUF2061 domain-containing protein [Candidatus Omnitrophota bacterium]
MSNTLALETHARAWVKSVVWRVLGIVILGVISWLVTHSWKEMTIITLIFHGLRFVLYYFHERLWERITWGRKKHPLSEFKINKSRLAPEDKQIIEQELKSLGYID